MTDNTIKGDAGRLHFRTGPLENVLDARTEEEKQKEAARPQLPVFLVDEFERHLAEANQFAKVGRSADACAALSKAHDYLRQTKDDALRLDLLIRLRQAQSLIKA